MYLHKMLHYLSAKFVKRVFISLLEMSKVYDLVEHPRIYCFLKCFHQYICDIYQPNVWFYCVWLCPSWRRFVNVSSLCKTDSSRSLYVLMYNQNTLLLYIRMMLPTALVYRLHVSIVLIVLNIFNIYMLMYVGMYLYYASHGTLKCYCLT